MPDEIPDHPARAELRLWEQALRQDWAIPPEVKRRLLQVAVNLVDPDTEEDLTAELGKNGKPIIRTAGRVKLGAITNRTKLAALRVIVQFGHQSIEQQRLDLSRRQLDGSPAEAEPDAVAPAAAERALKALNDPSPADVGAEHAPGDS
jgi:hypothetical protein